MTKVINMPGPPGHNLDIEYPAFVPNNNLEPVNRPRTKGLNSIAGRRLHAFSIRTQF